LYSLYAWLLLLLFLQCSDTVSWKTSTTSRFYKTRKGFLSEQEQVENQGQLIDSVKILGVI